MKLKTFKNLNLRNKTVLLRVNFDVALKNKKVVDDSRIQSHLPTIKLLLKKGARIVLISHLGRPEKVKSMRLKIERYGLKPVFNHLQKIIRDLEFIDSLEWPVIKEKSKNKKIVLLENLRFYPGEKDNDKNFAKFLASLADLYINDAFPVCHRNHASVVAITNYLPSYAGLLLEKEIKNLSEVLNKPKKPLIVLMGGAKVSNKAPVIKNMAKKADKILIGGALANDFLKASGYQISQSLSEPVALETIKKLSLAVRKKVVLPVDVKIKLNIKNKKSKRQIKNLKVSELNKIKDKSFRILDLGPETINLFAKHLRIAKMIVWNGPMGLFEEKPFDLATRKITETVVENEKARIIIGGGETIAALRQSRINADCNRGSTRIFVSMGGGAMLEFLAGKKFKSLIKLKY